MVKSNSPVKIQRILLALAIAAGIIFADGIIFAPVHEWGHVHWADLEGNHGQIADWNHARLDKLSPGNLMAGYESEIVLFLVIYAVLFFISSPYAPNFRRFYFHLGFPLAYATWSWLKPLLFPVSDFIRVPEWTNGMRGTLFTEYVIAIIIAWAMLLIARVRVMDK